MPHLVEMHKKHKDQGLVVVSVSLDSAENKDQPLAFLKKQGADFINVLLDEDSELYQPRLRFIAPPCYFVFSRQGQWTQFRAEDGKEDMYEAMDKLVVELLKEK